MIESPQVGCDIQHKIYIDTDFGESVGLVATCQKCDHQVRCFGDTDRSVRKAMVKMRQTCPGKEDNYYVPSDGSDKPENLLPPKRHI